MVAYSFKQQFRTPILAGIKRQTIRADRKRHARPGEELQLYTSMRTRQCALIGLATCESVQSVRLDIDRDRFEILGLAYFEAPSIDEFARLDGFADWSDMREFWRREHPDTPVFSGVLIRWGALL